MFICQWHLEIPFGKQALQGISAPQFRVHAETLALFIVPGSQRWEVLRVVS